MNEKTTDPWGNLWRLFMFVAALGALYNLSEIQGDMAGIRQALLQGRIQSRVQALWRPR